MFLKFVGKYYKRYWYYFLIGIITLIAIDYIQLLVPKFLGEITGIFENSIINGTFTADDSRNIINICLYTCLVALVMFLGRFLWRVTIFNASHRIEKDLRHDMFAKAEKLPTEYYHNNKVGTIMSWFTTDIEVMEEFFGWGTIQLIDSLFLSMFVFAKMFALKWQMTVIIMIPLLLIIVWGALVEKAMDKKWSQRQYAYDELYDFSQESFTGIRVLKAFVKERKELRAFSKIAKKNKAKNISFVRFSVIFDIMIEIIVGFISALLFAVGGYFVFLTKKDGSVNFLNEFSFSLSDLIEFFGYYDSLIWPMIALGQTVTMFSRCSASLKRITAFLNAPIDVYDDPGAIDIGKVDGEIEFKNLNFKYPGSNKNYLNNISFHIKNGQRIGVVGRLGCGKTTLVNCLFKLYNVDNGSIFIDGKDINEITSKSLRDNISYVPQDNFLFSTSIKENVSFSNDEASMDEIVEACKFSGVYEDIRGFSDGFETIIGERGVMLSGGQKQRISIARAYLKNAPIMILDDSVSAVDVKTEEEILKNIFHDRINKTTIVIASRISTIAHMDKILVLNEGEVEAFDKHENLLKTCKTYQKMYAYQKLENEIKGAQL